MEKRETIVDVVQGKRFPRREEVGCPLCGEKKPSRPISVSFGMTAYVAECPPCRVAFQTPRPSPEATLAYMNWRWQSSDGYVAHVDGQQQRALNQVEVVKRYAREPIRLLDFGAGAGNFVRAALDQGWNVTGVERSDSAISRAKEFYDVDVLRDIPDKQYNVITMWDVVEHLRDPEGILKMLGEHLTDDGYLFIETGNIESWTRVLRKDKWRLHLFDHQYYFSPSSLQQVLQRAGYGWFSLVDIKRNRPRINSRRLLRHPVRSTKAWTVWATTRAKWPHTGINVMIAVARKKAGSRQ